MKESYNTFQDQETNIRKINKTWLYIKERIIFNLFSIISNLFRPNIQRKIIEKYCIL